MFNYRAVNHSGDFPTFNSPSPDIPIPLYSHCALPLLRLPQLDTSLGTGVATALCDVLVTHACRLDHDGCCQPQYIRFVDAFC